MGFFDSIKKAVGAVASKAGLDIGLDKGSNIDLDNDESVDKSSEVYQNYYNTIEAFYLTFVFAPYNDSNWKMSYDQAKKAVVRFCSEEVEERVLKQAYKDYITTDKRYFSRPKVQLDAIECVRLMDSEIVDKMSSVMGEYIDNLGKYKDYTLDNVFGKICRAIGITTAKQEIYPSVIYMKELENRVLKGDESVINAILPDAITFFWVNQSSEDSLTKRKLSMRISNFASFLSKGGTYTPLSDKEWDEVQLDYFKFMLEDLSPERTEYQKKKILEGARRKGPGVGRLDTEYVLRSNETFCDAIMYYCYLLIKPEENEDFSVSSICSVLTNTNISTEQLAAFKVARGKIELLN